MNTINKFPFVIARVLEAQKAARIERLARKEARDLEVKTKAQENHKFTV